MIRPSAIRCSILILDTPGWRCLTLAWPFEGVVMPRTSYMWQWLRVAFSSSRHLVSNQSSTVGRRQP